MIDLQARPRGYLKLLGLVVGMGLISVAIALPGAVRPGLHPRTAFTSRVSALTGDVRLYPVGPADRPGGPGRV